jgi:hypothetical protein
LNCANERRKGRILGSRELIEQLDDLDRAVIILYLDGNRYLQLDRCDNRR